MQQSVSGFVVLSYGNIYPYNALLYRMVSNNRSTCWTEIVRVTALVGNSSFLDQDGVDHGSPLSLGTRINNGGSGDLNGWGDVCS